MAFCKRCNSVLRGVVWGEGYCTLACEREGNRDDWLDCAPLYDPNDPTGAGVIAANRNEVVAMLDAGAIDKRLPKIIMLRKRGMSLQDIGRSMQPRISHTAVSNILGKLQCKHLRECGLHIK